MKYWLVKFEEDLPIDKDYYSYRMSMLADALLENGHQIVRWASDFNHKLQCSRFNKRHSIKLSPRYRLELIKNRFKYSSSHSLGRLIGIYAQSFSLFIAMFRDKEKPDAVIVAMPAPITCLLTAIFCRIKNIPFFVDARDMWPDIVLNEAVGIKKLLIMPLYCLMFFELKISCKMAHGLIGITPPFMNFLLKYAGRKAGINDGHFPLGFKEKNYFHDPIEEHNYWNKHGVTFSDKTHLIYFAGTMNQTVLSEAAKVASALRVLSCKDIPVKLIMCGKGNSQKEIKLLFKDLNNVIFPGHVSASHLAFLKSKSSLALLAIEPRMDYINSLSNKFFDYASGALPIITNLRGLPKKVLEENQAGYFYKDSDELVDIINLLVTNTSIRNLYSQNSIKMFNKHFNANIVYSKYAKHIEKNTKL